VAIWLPAPIGLVALTSLRRTLARWAGAKDRVDVDDPIGANVGDRRVAFA
jgi:hypothetical protein